MTSDNSQRDLLADPKISALMASIESSTDVPVTKQKKSEIEHPPLTFDDFLKDEQIV